MNMFIYVEIDMKLMKNIKKDYKKKTKERQDTIKKKLQHKQYIEKEAKKLGLL